MDIGGLVEADRDVEGVVELMQDATQNYTQPLTAERVFGWLAALFPTGRSGMSRITVGCRETWIGLLQMAREQKGFRYPRTGRKIVNVGRELLVCALNKDGPPNEMGAAPISRPRPVI